MTDELVEQLARGMHSKDRPSQVWGECGAGAKERYLQEARAALEAAARTAQPAPANEVVAVCEALTEQGLTDECGFDDRWRERVATQVLTFLSVARPQLTATREKLTEALKAHMNFIESYGDRDPNMPMEECLFCTCDPGEPLYTWVQTSPDDTSDERFRIAWADHMSAVLASGVVQEASAQPTPVVDEKRLADVVYAVLAETAQCPTKYLAEKIARRLASGVFQTEAKVLTSVEVQARLAEARADALEAYAIGSNDALAKREADKYRARAAAIRAGEQA